MSEVNVTPEDLHAAGESITGVREDMADSPGLNAVQEDGSQHYMTNDTGRLSGGYFKMSLMADELMFQRNAELQLARADIVNNLMALSSAVHIAADVYTAGDLENAIEFAFVASDVPPEGLPAYIKPDQTLGQLREDAQQEAADGGRDGDGPGGNESGSGDDQPAERRVPIQTGGYGNGSSVGYLIYDSDDKLLRTEYIEYHANGSQTVTTYVDGELTGTETRSPDMNDALDRTLGDQRAEMERELREAGIDPDNPDEWPGS